MMDDLKQLYFRIENPIDNKIKWNKLLNIYSSSFDYEDFYNFISSKNDSTDICYDSDDKKTFCLFMWSIWKKKLLSIPEEELRTYIDNKVFDFNIYDVIMNLRDLESVKSYSNLEKNLSDPTMNMYYSDLFDDYNHKVVIYSDFDLKKDTNLNTVLSIKVDAINLYKLLKLYINQCLNLELPYYIKYSEYGERIVVNFYSSIENFRKVEEILNVLKKENYSFFHTNQELLFGNIDNWIAIRNKDFFNSYQYLRERSMIFFKSIDSVIYEYILGHTNTLVSYKDGRMNIIDYLSTYVMEKIVSQLLNKSIKNDNDFFNIANSDDIINLKSYIRDKLSINMKNILITRLYLKKPDEKITVQLNPNKSIDIEIGVFMCAIRNLTQTLISKDPSIEKLFRIRIKNECQFYKVDPDKFCLDVGFSKKLFFNKEKYDNYKKEIDKIHDELVKVQSLDELINSEINQNTRDKISDGMNELRSIFGEEETN